MAQCQQNRPQGDFKGFQRGQAPLAAHAEALMRRLVRIGDVGAYTYESAHQCLSVGSSEGWVVGQASVSERSTLWTGFLDRESVALRATLSLSAESYPVGLTPLTLECPTIQPS